MVSARALARYTVSFPPPTNMAELTVLFSIPALRKKSAQSAWGAIKDILSPPLISKLPSGITTSSPRSTAQISTLLFNRLTTSITFIRSRMDSLGIRNLRSSILPLANSSILMALGKRSSLAISLAAASSGLMARERFSSSLI